MEKIKNLLKTFTAFEKALWLISVTVIITVFCIFGGNVLSLIGSLIGATALIFLSKGNVIGQVLIVIFSVFYGIVSWTFNYYGEMITYLGMTTPIAIFAVITWLKNPFDGNKTEVKVNSLKGREYVFCFFLTLAVTVAFYFILRALNTANLIISTVSVFTSFAASYLTLRRNEFLCLFYAANDAVLIAMWIMATITDVQYLPTCICFAVFFVNDTYGFFNWLKMKKAQASPAQE